MVAGTPPVIGGFDVIGGLDVIFDDDSTFDSSVAGIAVTFASVGKDSLNVGQIPEFVGLQRSSEQQVSIGCMDVHSESEKHW